MEKSQFFMEKYRPQFHFSAYEYIINDPNGLVYYNGEYHLFHQYNILEQIHWGHAVSKDLVHWEHVSNALFPDEIGQIWSGSIVVDWNNTAGLQINQEKTLIAFFTYSQHESGVQSQGMAYSNDCGVTWSKYKYNPVLPNPGIKDFRDPKVFWYSQLNKWIMILATGNHVTFYSSDNLLNWNYIGKFGEGQGCQSGIWECPDLFQLQVDENDEIKKWVLVVSINNGAPAGGTGMQYFIGEFNGNEFINENTPETVLWLDYGKDFYAGVTWNDIPEEDGRRLMVAWADNWLYRDYLPTIPFKGQFSSVRELYLKTFEEGIRIVQKPNRELQSIRGESVHLENKTIKKGEVLKLPLKGECLEILTEFRIKQEFNNITSEKEFCIRISTDKTHYTMLSYNPNEHKIYIDRTYSGINSHEKFPGKFEAKTYSNDSILKLHILLDRSQVELFVNDGKTVMTNLIFPELSEYEVEVYSTDIEINLEKLDQYKLERVW